MNLKNRTINIFGTKYQIKFVDKCEHKENFAFGLCDQINHIIYVPNKNNEGKDLPKEEIELSLLHEIIHAILISGQYLASNEDEPLVEWIARCIYSLIKQNVICWKI